MSLSENDKRVLRLIKVGAENSITGAEISLITKLAERTVQDIISRLITRHSVPIVGVRHGTFRGYFIESEQDLAHGILEVVERYLEARDTHKPRLTGLISAQEVMYELDIKYLTLQKWEKAGLRRYQPPLEETRKIYYRISDLMKFLGVENG